MTDFSNNQPLPLRKLFVQIKELLVPEDRRRVIGVLILILVGTVLEILGVAWSSLWLSCSASPNRSLLRLH